MTQRTPTEQAAIAAALSRLNSYSPGFPADGLYTAREAEPDCCKVRGADWDETKVLAHIDSVVDWAENIDGKTLLRLVNDEVLIGWFEGDGDPDAGEDRDGEFMSSPSVTEDDRWPAEDFADACIACERDGFLLVCM
jgi:hypothetical protein